MGDNSTSLAVHIFADTEAALERMRAAAGAAGCRIVSAQRIGDGAVPPACVPGAALLIELEDEAAGDAAIPLLDWLRGEAEQGARRGVVSGPVGLIDLIAAQAGHDAIEHLCAPDEAERLAAIARAGGKAEPRLHDAGRESSARLMQRSPDYRADDAGPVDAAFIRAMIRARRRRAHYLPTGLFADPVWDMLLDLLASRLEGRKVAVSSLCIAAAVPPTTALRWIGVMAGQGLLRRMADPEDGRRCHVELAEPTAQALGAWLRETRRLLAETA